MIQLLVSLLRTPSDARDITVSFNCWKLSITFQKVNRSGIWLEKQHERRIQNTPWLVAIERFGYGLNLTGYELLSRLYNLNVHERHVHIAKSEFSQNFLMYI